ncbi:MAG: hypothetical protein R2838_15375 [Caldilineaceae bacterium]
MAEQLNYRMNQIPLLHFLTFVQISGHSVAAYGDNPRRRDIFPQQAQRVE